MKSEEKPLSIFSASLRVFFISMLFWGAFFAAWGWQAMQHQRRIEDERFTLRKIAARSTTVDKVPLFLLSSLLEIREGVSLFSIQPEEVLDRIKFCSAFQYARVWRLLPGTLGVEYTLRTPVASLGGVRNVVFDRSGTCFFLLPFFPPKKLPVVILDFPKSFSLEELQQNVNSKDLALASKMAVALSSFASRNKLILERIDLSKRNHPNIFRREIVLVFSSLFGKKGEYLYVRSHARSLSFKKLKSVFAYVFASGFYPGLIDMRFPSCVLVQKELP